VQYSDLEINILTVASIVVWWMFMSVSEAPAVSIITVISKLLPDSTALLHRRQASS
jgi:hypothetical protein